MKIAVVIPTYNEGDNISQLITEILGLGIDDLEIVVIDDNSPDGTGQIVEEIRKQEKRLHVLHRKDKLGLGTAYMEGFKFALVKNAEYFFEIDADFSHDFSIIPIFLENIKNFDLVLGSRYISGGKTGNWNLLRRLVSKFGNYYARIILGVPINDLTTGYRCYRKEVIKHLIQRNVDSIGYVFQIETTYRAFQQGFKIKEIPIIFVERRSGRSKFDLKIIWESFWKVLKLKFQE